MEELEARDYRAALRVVESVSRANTLEGFRHATLDGVRDRARLPRPDVLRRRDGGGRVRRRQPPTVLGRAGTDARPVRVRLLARGRVRAARARSRCSARARPSRCASCRGRRAPGSTATSSSSSSRTTSTTRSGSSSTPAGPASRSSASSGDGRRPFGRARRRATGAAHGSAVEHPALLHARRARAPRSAAALSPREREVAELVAGGLTNREIARTLCIGEPTVKKHVTRALAATGCSSRTQLAITWRG